MSESSRNTRGVWWGGLLALVLLLCSIAIGFLLLPIRSCLLCRGVGHLERYYQGPPTQVVCPECSGNGRVTCYAYLKYKQNTSQVPPP